MTGIAALPMYARAELVGPFARLWALVVAELSKVNVAAPTKLSAPDDLQSHWLDPELILSQTCGMPYRLMLHGKVQLVGTPDYGLEGCPPGYYRSAFVARRDDLRGTPNAFADAVFVYNEAISQSGFAAPLKHAQTAGFTFENRIQSYGHIASGRMVAEGKADIAALDAQSWAHMQRYDGFAQNLKVLGWTHPPTPALPFITALRNDAAAILLALQSALDNLEPNDKAAIGIKDILQIPAGEYLAVENPCSKP